MLAEVLYAVIDGDPQTGFQSLRPFTEAQTQDLRRGIQQRCR